MSITENKTFEVQSMYSINYDILDFIIHFSIIFKGSDHAGPEFYIQLGRFYFGISIRDKRHWDYDNNKWEIIETKN
jgi:hypothetical protein